MPGPRSRARSRRRSATRRSSSPTGCPSRTPTSVPTASRSRCRRRRRPPHRPVERDGRAIAALVHDASLDDEPELVEAVAAAAGDRARERAPAGRAARPPGRAARLARRASSRPATPSAAGSSATSTTARSSGSSRSRCSCGCPAGRIRDDPPTAEAAARRRASDELAQSLEELRELARGIHPGGARPRPRRRARVARRALAGARPRLDVELAERLPAPVEVAAYFLVVRGAGQRRQVRARDGRRPCDVGARGRRRVRRDRRRRQRRRRPGARLRAARPRRPRRGARRPPARLEPTAAGPASARRSRARSARRRQDALREGVARAARRGRVRGRRRRPRPPRSCSRAVDAARARRRDRRHPDAADPHRRGAARRAGDPRAAPRVGVLVLSQHVESGLAMKLLAETRRGRRLHAQGPRRRPRRLRRALRRVAAGGSALDPTIVSQLLASAARRGPLATLTAARARGARADGRGPLQPGRSPSGSRSPSAACRSTSRASSPSSDCRPATDDHRRVLAVLAYLRLTRVAEPRGGARSAYRRHAGDRLPAAAPTASLGASDQLPEGHHAFDRSSSRHARRPSRAVVPPATSSAATARARPPSTRCAASPRHRRAAG